MTEIILGFISTHEYKEKDVWETMKERTGLGDTELWVNWKGQLEDDSFWSWNPRLMLVLLMKWGKLGSWCFFGGGGGGQELEAVAVWDAARESVKLLLRIGSSLDQTNISKSLILGQMGKDKA